MEFNNFSGSLAESDRSLPTSYVHPFPALRESGVHKLHLRASTTSSARDRTNSNVPGHCAQNIDDFSSQNQFNAEDPSTLPSYGQAKPTILSDDLSHEPKQLKSLTETDYPSTRLMEAKNGWIDNLDYEKEYKEIQASLLGAISSLFLEETDELCKIILDSMKEKLKFVFHETSRTFYVLIRQASIYRGLNDDKTAFGMLGQAESDEKKWKEALKGDAKEYARWRRILYTMKADILKNRKEYKSSEDYLKKSWEISQEYFEDAAEDYLDFRSVILGEIAEAREDYKKAKEFYLDGLAIRLEQSEEHPRLLSSSYNDLARIEKKLGNMDAAREYLNQAIRFKEAFEEAKHSLTGVSVFLSRGEVSYKNVVYEEL